MQNRTDAESINSFSGNVSLVIRCGHNVTRMAPALAKLRGYLSLEGLRSLTPETAAALANDGGKEINLEGLTNWTPELASMLSASKIWNGSLPSLKTLTPEKKDRRTDATSAFLELFLIKMCLNNAERDRVYTIPYGEFALIRGNVLIFFRVTSD